MKVFIEEWRFGIRDFFFYCEGFSRLKGVRAADLVSEQQVVYYQNAPILTIHLKIMKVCWSTTLNILVFIARSTRLDSFCLRETLLVVL